jgi:hypothetical protein
MFHPAKSKLHNKIGPLLATATAYYFTLTCRRSQKNDGMRSFFNDDAPNCLKEKDLMKA